MIKVDGMTIVAEPPKKPKKITGTRLAAILGLDHWKTPFQVWCDITKVYVEPFEDNVYTVAGKIIEPKVIAYLDKRYHFGKGKLKDPEQWYGKTKEQMYYDHFPKEKILGGMWDARTETCVYELKTSKRFEDWFKDGEFDAPMNYKIQGALYAYLLGLDEFALVLSITDDEILADPEKFIPTPDNTLFRKYKLSEDMPNFEAMISYALEWYDKHVIGGVSPDWDPKKDQDIIRALTTQAVDLKSGDPISQIIELIEPLQRDVDQFKAKLDELDELKTALKDLMLQAMNDTDKHIVAKGRTHSFEVTKSISKRLDQKALKDAGLYDQYVKEAETTTLKITTVKEN